MAPQDHLDRSKTASVRTFLAGLKRGFAASRACGAAVPGMRPGGRSGRGRAEGGTGKRPGQIPGRCSQLRLSSPSTALMTDGAGRAHGCRKPQPAPSGVLGSSDPWSWLPYRHRSRSPSSLLPVGSMRRPAWPAPARVGPTALPTALPPNCPLGQRDDRHLRHPSCARSRRPSVPTKTVGRAMRKNRGLGVQVPSSAH